MIDRQNDLVGKDLLEQLMFSLYPEAETIYREYLQNACDSINEAVRRGILSDKGEGHVTINIDRYDRSIVIEDNGTGIKAEEAEMTLKQIARSKKRRDTSAGIYGIGRLVGGGYCRQLVFSTSAKGEQEASEIVFDMDKVRKILGDDEDVRSASEVIHDITSFQRGIPEDVDRHFFRVELREVLPDYHDVLLDEVKICSYLLQVAPIPYEATFYNNLIVPNIAKEDEKYREYYGQLNAVKVSVNDYVGIEKPYETKFKGTEYGDTEKDNAPINEIRFFSVSDCQLGDLAWGWYAYTPAGTQIRETDPFTGEKVLCRGIRLRCHNIQVGDENVLNKYFKQARSHTYFNGEVFILNQEIKPTTDRSDIVPTAVAKKFQERLEEFFRNELEKLYQEANKANKQLEKIRKADEEIQKINNSVTLPPENKEERVRKLWEERQKAHDKLSKTISKGTDSTQRKSMQDLANNFNKQYCEYVNTPLVSEQEPIVLNKTIDERIDELNDRYNEREVSLVRKIFDILDVHYKKKHEQIVINIKESVLHDLKK